MPLDVTPLDFMSLGWTIHSYDSVSSTQDIARDFAERGDDEGCVVHALTQTQGRGRHGREWRSQHGNLSLSLILRPKGALSDIGQLALVSAVALMDSIHAFAQGLGVDEDGLDGLTLKWPNDVLWCGQKCAGILLETDIGASGALHYVVLGIGVNLASAPYEGSVALSDILPEQNGGVDVCAFRDCFLTALARHYHVWQSKGFDPIRQSWLKYACSARTPMRVKIGTQLEKGLFHDIDEAGNLRMVIIDPDGQEIIRHIAAGDVFYEEGLKP